MKNIFLIIFLLCTVSYSQERMNPDGYIGGLTFESFSGFGDVEYKEFFSGEHVGSTNLSQKMTFNFRVLLPITERLTIGLTYESKKIESRFVPSNDIFSNRNSNGSGSYYTFHLKYYIKPFIDFGN